MRRSKLEILFCDAWAEAYGDQPTDMQEQYRFAPDRLWRLDVAWPSRKVAVELNGIGFGHQSIAGIRKDAEKLRAAVLRGWRVLVYTSACLGSREKRAQAVEEVWRLLCGVLDDDETGRHEDFPRGPEQSAVG